MKIKFRAFDKYRKEYLSAGNIFLSINEGKNPDDCALYLDIITDPDKYANRFIVEQFTGLLDANGNEIYEGDIIKGSLSVWHTIKYDDKTARFVASILDTDDCCSLSQSWINEFDKSVIGNIHNNLKSLKGGDQ